MGETKQLIDRILAGDTNVFRALIEANERLVSHIVFRMVNNDSDREDICQDIFLKVYRNLENFHFECKLSTWIAKITYNACINYLKKKQPLLFDDCSPNEETIENHASDFQGPEDFAAESDLSERLQDEINSLPMKFRSILTLYHVHEMSYAEIAEITQLPDGTVKSYLFRARKLLKEKLMSKYQLEEIWH